MAIETTYWVQPYWSDRAKLARGVLRQFARREAALRAGEAAARQVGGAIVYSVDGDPAFAEWERPRLLAAHGSVPDVRF